MPRTRGLQTVSDRDYTCQTALCSLRFHLPRRTTASEGHVM